MPPAQVRKPPQIDTLALARRIEAVSSRVRQLRTRYRTGPARRTRKRVRKQLAKLCLVLDRLQRETLTPSASHEQAELVRQVDALDALLGHAMTHLPSKHDLRKLRLAFKRLRREFALLLDSID